MKHNRTLNQGIVELIDGMTETHRSNWRKLIEFMRESDSSYSQGEFSGTSAEGNCALSYAIAADIVKADRSTPNSFSSYDEVADEKFGPGAFDYIFGGSSYPDEDLGRHEEHDLADFSYHVFGMTNLRDVSSSSVANALEAMLNLDEVANVSKVTVHWKSNQKDVFSSVESLREFMDLNPHRRKGYRKITQTRLVERIIHEEVTETITL